jgi:simple sugar transport system permease protein
MIEGSLWVAILIAAMRKGTPPILAALGDLIVKKAGCVNLGVEQMMLVGAVTGFAVGLSTGNFARAFLVAAVAGAVPSMVPAAWNAPAPCSMAAGRRRTPVKASRRTC